MTGIHAPFANSNETDLSGRQLGNYQLLRRLGRGAMAEVYLAEQTTLRRQVAIKVLRGSLATDASYVQRFHREAQAAASLVHPKIVQIYEVGCVDGIHFIAQEYVQGSNLGEVIARKGPPPLKQSLSIMLQAASALHKAAEHGIVHRDIKPENILLADSSEVKVADFGLARVNGAETSTTLTQAGFTMGTPLYMSPEQIEGKPLDGRSDIYSLGVTCYHMLAGQPPFRAETALAVAVQHLQEQPARLENLRPDLPPALCRMVHKMLAKAPEDRYPNARELCRDLRALAATQLSDVDLNDSTPETDDWTPAGGTSRAAALARLNDLMKSAADRHASAARGWRWWAAVIVVAFVGGLAVAKLRSRPVLRPLQAAALSVERKPNAQAQFVYALMVDTEEAWKSVAAYHPEDRLYVLRAQQQLARLYLNQEDYARALAIFNEFAEQPNVEVQYRAFGLLGQAFIYTQQGKYERSADKLAELWPIRNDLDPQMRDLVAYVLQKNQAAMAGDAKNDWAKFLQPSLPRRRD